MKTYSNVPIENHEPSDAELQQIEEELLNEIKMDDE